MSTSELMRYAGIRIIYSLPGLKVHAKVALILRKDTEEGLPRPGSAYLSTGNFNEKTAEIYSDMAMLTTREDLIEDIKNVFAVLEGKLHSPEFHRLLVARFNMVTELKRLIHQEMEHARQGRKSRIILKMNGLHDREMIDELYRASESGVEIDLIIRGICCLIPNQPYSRNIRITRIVDMFLEHARIWYFYNDGEEDLYLSSADWMRRNLSRRIETASPILDRANKQEVINLLNLQLSDNTKACFIDEHLNNNFKRDDNPVKVRTQVAMYAYLNPDNN
jgi:polyphosphate kinase